MSPARVRTFPVFWGAVALAALTACQGGDAPTAPGAYDASMAKVPPTVAVDLPSDLNATPSGLVGWWRGDGDASEVTGIHDGDLWGDTHFDTGLVGSSFWFDGVGEVVIPNQPDLNPSELTVAAWVYPTGLDGDIDIIMNKEYREDGFSNIQYEIGVRGSANPTVGTLPEGNFAIYVRNAGGLPSAKSGWADGYAAIPLDTWTHVAMSFDGETVRAIVNGEVTREIAGVASLLTPSEGPFKIGSRGDWTVNLSPIERWEGGIDDAMLFARALAPVEVRLIYIRGLVGSLVTDGTLKSGQGNALLAKIATAQAKLEQGSLKASRAALGAFLNQVAAWARAGVLSAGQALLLEDPVTKARNEI